MHGLVGRSTANDRVRVEQFTRWFGTVFFGASAAYMVVAGIVLLVEG